MAHVHISQDDAVVGPLKIVIDGVDLSRHIYDEGFGLVKVGPEDGIQEWGVRMIVAADSLDIDLPQAVVEAVERSDAQVVDVVAAKKALIECMGLLGRLYGEVEA